MKSTIAASIFFLALGIASTSSSSAGELTTSRFNDLKLNCDTCHGVGGHSPAPDQVPSLAGKSQKYLISQLKAFEKGKRQHQTMTLLGGSMTYEEMKAMAYFYSHGGK
jgi:cytochrome c553